MTQPKWLLVEAVLAMHKMLIAEHGGRGEVRDRGLLESALARPQNLFGYEDRKPPLTRLAASYAFGITKNHPFLDGNKRVALTAAAVFLEINGTSLEADEAEAVAVFRDLAGGSLSEDELAVWLDQNTRKVKPG
jgi:death-on-curing protein